MKTIIKSIVLLASLCFAHYSRGQNNDVHLNVSNSSGCNWNVSVLDGSLNVLQTWSGIGSGGLVFSCGGNPYAVPVQYVTVDDGTCVLTFGSGGGSFPYTLISGPCGGTTCSSAIDCSGGIPSICNPSPNSDPYIIIRIF